MIDLFVFFPLVKGKEWQTNCLPVMISHAWNHAELEGLCFMHAVNISRSQILWKNSQLENLDDAYIILMSMFATCK